jgi:cyclophilin family peptidyl-prolyl cis-trans isomerase
MIIMKTKSIYNGFLLATLFFSVSCFEKTKESEGTPISADKITAADLKIDSNRLSKAKITIKTVHGNIIFKFYPRQAPNTVTRIIELTNEGFFDGLVFHRVVENFVIQGGDPTGTGMGGSGKRLRAEFNSIQHIKGTVAMARAQDKDSADSQFYIALTTLPHLDDKYTVFGQVVEGMEILTKVKQGEKILSMVFEK